MHKIESLLPEEVVAGEVEEARILAALRRMEEEGLDCSCTLTVESEAVAVESCLHDAESSTAVDANLQVVSVPVRAHAQIQPAQMSTYSVTIRFPSRQEKKINGTQIPMYPPKPCSAHFELSSGCKNKPPEDK